MTPSKNVRQLAAALEWASRGFDVLPLHSVNTAGDCTCGKSDCASPGKHPRTKHGYRDASSDPSAIRRWFEATETSNIGVVPGSGGCVVIDIDPRNIESDVLDSWLTEHEDALASSPLVLTGNYETARGRHYWFRHSQANEFGSGQLRDGIELKSGRGYVVVPPSSHATGVQYELDSGTFESIPVTPDWLGNAMRATSPSTQAEGVESHGLTGLAVSGFTLDSIRSGLRRPKEGQTQRETAVGIARNLRESGLPYELVRVLLGLALFHPDAALRSDDPWTEKDAKAIVDSVFVGAAPDHADHVPPRDVQFRIQTLADAITTAEAPIRWLVTGLVAASEKAVLAAPPKAKKTFLALHLARCVALGEPFLGEERWSVEEPGPVLFVQEEHAPQQWAKRVVTVFEDAPDAPFHFMHRENLALTEAAHVDALIAAALSVCARLIVIDPWQRVTPGVNENDAGDTESSWRAIHRIADRTGAVVLVIHHANKGDGELGMDMIRGSSRMAGEVDLILVGRKRGATLELFVEGRDIEEGPEGNIEIAHEPDAPHRMRQAGIRIKAKPRNHTRTSVETVLRGADRPLTTSEVAEGVSELHSKPVGRPNVEAHLKRFADDGHVRRSERDDGRKTADWEWVVK